MIKTDTNTATETATKAKYKYLTSLRINSTIKKHGLQIAYTKGDGYFYFTDLVTGNQVGESVYVARMWHLTIDQWREAAAQAAATRTNGSEADEQVRELVSTLDEEVDPENCPF